MKQRPLLHLPVVSFLLSLMSLTSLAGNRYDFNFTISRPVDATGATVCPVHATLLRTAIGVTDPATANLVASYKTSSGEERFRTTNTPGLASGQQGHWFDLSGVPTNRAAQRAALVLWDKAALNVTHGELATEGTSLTVVEGLVNGQDSVFFHIHVTIAAAGSTESVTTDEPQFVGRRSETDGWLVRPLVQKNDEEPVEQNFIQVNEGDKITLSCEVINPDNYKSVRYRWLKTTMNPTTYQNEDNTVRRSMATAPYKITDNAVYADGARYVLRVTMVDQEGKGILKDYNYYVDVQSHAGEFMEWPRFKLSYDFHTEYPNLQKPAKLHTFTKKDGTPANHYEGEWWSAFWGDNLNAEVGTDSATIYTAAKNMVDKYDYDFRYIRDYMGWPPDLSARRGYKSFVYVFGSGLSNDNEANTTMGGYQSSTYADGQNWACVWASYYPFSRFRADADKKWGDGEYQRNAMVHEGIHAIFADLGACQGSSWFHEGGNTWLQGQVYAKRDGLYGEAGFLDGGPFLAPHMPIECYSGWLQDGSYGGPGAQGVNMYNGSGKQVCTWRSYLGGVQYANAFPVVVANVCGDGVIPWIWRNCKDYVLKTMGDSIGEEPMRQIVTEYRARQALFDLGGWDNSYRKVVNDNFGITVKPEWEPYWINVAPYRITPYQSVTLDNEDGWMSPDTLTNPGWSGGNIIPIHVRGDVANVEFRPEDTQMRALLCYRTKDGKCYYSQPVKCGNMSIDITEKPANGVVFCVVCNTDYVYLGDAQRKHHWDYRIRLGEGALAIADTYTRWYNYEQDLRDAFSTGIQAVQGTSKKEQQIHVMSTAAVRGNVIRLDLGGINPADVTVRAVGASGILVQQGHLSADGTFLVPANMPAGLCFFTFAYGNERQTVKMIVK